MNNNTIAGTGSVLMGVGIAKLDDVVIGLTLIGVGVILNILVAYLQQKGWNVQASNLG